jgi:hypothetical protein
MNTILMFVLILLKVKQLCSFIYCLFNDAISISGFGASNAVHVILLLIKLFALKDMK